MKEVMKISELVKEGYPEGRIRQISRSDRFDEVGFSMGEKRKTYFFNVAKLDRLLKELSYEGKRYV